MKAKYAQRVSTAEELAALPVGSCVEGRLGHADPDAYWRRDEDGWRLVFGDGRETRKTRQPSEFFFARAGGGRLTRVVFSDAAA